MTIKQIIPADGWYAKFLQQDGSSCYDKIVCFGLIDIQSKYVEQFEKNDGTVLNEIEGFSGTEYFDYSKLKPYFIGYVYSPNINLCESK